MFVSFEKNVKNLDLVNLMTLYSVMQSDGNSFCDNVGLNSFNKASRDEDNIKNQAYKKRICLNF